MESAYASEAPLPTPSLSEWLEMRCSTGTLWMIRRTSKREMKSKEEGPSSVSIHLRNYLEVLLEVTKGVSVYLRHSRSRIQRLTLVLRY